VGLNRYHPKNEQVVGVGLFCHPAHPLCFNNFKGILVKKTPK
jgi:hypothetical protein